MFTCRPPIVFRHSIRHATGAFLIAAYWLLNSCPLQALPPRAVPFVDIVSPASITPGSTGVSITVRGAGFVPSSVVHWNATALVSTFVSAREMTAAVPDALVAAVGLGSVTVISPAPGGGTSNVSYIPVASHIPVANFPATPSSSIGVGNTPQGIVTGDFNADGRIDLAVANSGDNTVSILLGNGDGTFTPQTPIAVGVGPHWLVTGDFNEDGKADFAVANSGDNTVSILLGNGDGTFTLRSSPGAGASPFAIAAGDFNADGHLDLAVTNSGDNTVTILLGNGDGTFVTAAALAAGARPQVLVVGDFNEDGKLDIAVANESDTSVSMLLGNGNGTFQAQTKTSTAGSGFPIGLIAADFNGDSHLDVAAVNATDVAILLGNGSGALTLNSNPGTGLNLISGVTGDYNGDGFFDIAVADQTLGQAFLLPGNGNGTFGTVVTYTTSAGTYSAATADFNGDGALDLAFTNGDAANVSIFLQSLPVSLTPTSLAFGNQAVGTSSAARVITLSNNSGATVHISVINISEAALDFVLSSTCGASVANAGTCTISVIFSPASVGARVATLSVTDDATNSPQTLALSGTGTVTSQTISKAFGAASIPLNGSTSLTFTIANPSASLALTGVAFTDSLPVGLIVGTPPNVVTTCTGTVTATAGGSSVSLSAGTLAVSSSCTISVDVLGTTAGVKNNSVTSTSTEAGTGNTSNTSVIVVAPPVISKAFGAASVPLNGSTSLSFTVNNANSAIALSGIAFSDTLPAGLVIATPNGVTGACGGGTITATQGTNVVSLSGASMAASASCTFTINVTGISAGTQNNTTGNITSTEGGTGGTASASLKVIAPPMIAKAFNPAGIALNATTALTFTISNPPANTAALTGVAFSDTLPTGITVASSSASVCGGTLTTSAPALIVLSGANVAISSQCQFSITVTGAAAGNFTNTTGSVTSTNGGTGNTATANLNVAAVPTIRKTFGAANIPLNGSTSLSFTVTNPNGSSALTGVSFADTLPAGLLVSTPNGMTGVCGGGTITAVAAGSNISLSGATLAASASCTFSVNVAGATAGDKINTTGVVSSTQSGGGATSNTATLTVLSPPVIAKAFGASSIAPGSSTTLTFTIQNPNASAALAGVAVTDTLPSGLVVSTPPSLSGSCGGATISAAAGATSVTLSAGIIPTSNSCTFAVNVTGTSVGTKVNTTGAVTSANGGTGNIASASLAVVAPVAPDLTITASHSGHFQQGRTGAVYTIIVTNAGNGPSSGAVTVTDTLSAGLSSTAISGSGWACTLGSLSCTRADTLVAGGSYAVLTVIVNVAATAPGSVTNVATVSGGGETNTANDTATDVTIVDAPADFSIVAAVNSATVNKGSKAAYVMTLTPLNNVPFATSINLAVSGVPLGTTFHFQPASVTPGANPATSTLLLFTSTDDTALAADINRGTAPLLALGFAFGMPLAGIVLAGRRRKNGGLNLKSPGAAILLFVLMGAACYGCASAAINHNHGTPAGAYNLTVTATGGTVQHSVTLTLTVR
jgi:uncharacterized repeat protein (TIGR01451 family)